MFHSLQHGQRIAGDGIAIHRARPPPLMRTVTFPSSLSTRVANPLISIFWPGFAFAGESTATGKL